MKTAVVIVNILCVCLSFSLAATGDAVSSVSIQVRITNETAGASPALDTEVALVLYRDSEAVDRRVGSLDAQGLCSFEDVHTGPGMAAVATAKHQNMMFSSRPISLEHVHDNFYELPVSVYDVSTDTSVLSIGTHHLVVRIDPQGLFVDEYLQIINNSDEAVTSTEKTPDGRPIVLKVYLPEGFRDIKCSKYFEEHALVMTEEGFFDTMAVPPGRHDAVFTYGLEMTSSTLDLIKKAGLPTEDFMIFSQLKGASLEGLAQSLGQMTLSDGSLADYYPSITLDPGNQVSFKITGLSYQKDQRDLWIMFGGIFGLVVVVGVLRTIRQKP